MPYVFDDAGLEIPLLSEIFEGMLLQLQEPEAFGDGFDISPDSPAYKLYTPVAIQLAELWQGLRDVHANRDPESATGASLSGLGSFAGVKYRAATASTIRGRVVGKPGAQVPAVVIIRYKASGTLWQLSSAPVIGGTGTVEVDAFSLDKGPIDADPVGIAGWEIVVGAGEEVQNFESLDKAALGEDVETAPEFRLRLLRAARGLATYDSIVREVSDVKNVSSLIYYQNEKLTFDPATGLKGKQAHLIVRGGAKQDIIAALHRAVGAPLETVGAVSDTVAPGNGQILKYSFSRLKRRRGYLSVTITGGNPKVPLPPNAEALAKAAIFNANGLVQGSTFVPYVFGQAAADAMPKGSVSSMTALGKLAPADPYVVGPIQLPIDEQIEVAVDPQPAEVFGNNEDPIFYEEGVTLSLKINGGGVQNPASTKFCSTTLALASDIGPQLADVEAGSVDGRFFLRTTQAGAAATIEVLPDMGNVPLGLVVDVYEGSDGDVVLVINP